MADSSEVDAAVIATLSADAQLKALLPNGVFWDLAADGATKFVIVSELSHDDTYQLPGGPLWERFLYLVKAVTQGSSGTDVKAAAVRIHELLQDVALTPTGYYPAMVVNRLRRIRFTELDTNTNQRWQHRGGHYEVWICPRAS